MNREGSDEASSSRRGCCHHWQRGGYLLVGRPWQLGWGATDEERGAALAGDDLIPDPDLTATRAITVHAVADQVWPWITQVGQGRGGFYSYDALENLVGCHIHSADRVVPPEAGRQGRRPGKAPPGGWAGRYRGGAGRALVLRGAVPMAPCRPLRHHLGVVLRERPEGTTRLLVRERYAYTKRWAPFLIEPVAAVAFVMSQRMLRRISGRAERAGRPTV
jgi:hypothetical protein